jgi:hypothetical protein
VELIRTLKPLYNVVFAVKDPVPSQPKQRTGELGLYDDFAPRVDVERWRPLSDIAAIYGTTNETVRRWVKEGMPTRRMGSQHRCKRSEAADWLAARGIKPVPH